LVFPLLFIYPIGIPLFFFFMLYRYRTRLHQAGIRAELGFLYDGYERTVWYFEMIDMAHKLVVTSLIAFLPKENQMQVAMVVVVVYFIIILLTKPFLRKGDDRLQLLSLVEILMLLMSANVFVYANGYDPVINSVLSVVLIAVVILFLTLFLTSALNVLWKVLRKNDFIRSHFESRVRHFTRCWRQMVNVLLFRRPNYGFRAAERHQRKVSRQQLLDDKLMKIDRRQLQRLQSSPPSGLNVEDGAAIVPGGGTALAGTSLGESGNSNMTINPLQAMNRNALVGAQKVNTESDPKAQAQPGQAQAWVLSPQGGGFQQQAGQPGQGVGSAMQTLQGQGQYTQD